MEMDSAERIVEEVRWLESSAPSVQGKIGNLNHYPTPAGLFSTNTWPTLVLTPSCEVLAVPFTGTALHNVRSSTGSVHAVAGCSVEPAARFVAPMHTGLMIERPGKLSVQPAIEFTCTVTDDSQAKTAEGVAPKWRDRISGLFAPGREQKTVATMTGFCWRAASALAIAEHSDAPPEVICSGPNGYMLGQSLHLRSPACVLGLLQPIPQRGDGCDEDGHVLMQAMFAEPQQLSGEQLRTYKSIAEPVLQPFFQSRLCATTSGIASGACLASQLPDVLRQQVSCHMGATFMRCKDKCSRSAEVIACTSQMGIGVLSDGSICGYLRRPTSAAPVGLVTPSQNGPWWCDPEESSIQLEVIRAISSPSACSSLCWTAAVISVDVHCGMFVLFVDGRDVARVLIPQTWDFSSSLISEVPLVIGTDIETAVLRPVRDMPLELFQCVNSLGCDMPLRLVPERTFNGNVVNVFVRTGAYRCKLPCIQSLEQYMGFWPCTGELTICRDVSGSGRHCILRLLIVAPVAGSYPSDLANDTNYPHFLHLPPYLSVVTDVPAVDGLRFDKWDKLWLPSVQQDAHHVAYGQPAFTSASRRSEGTAHSTLWLRDSVPVQGGFDVAVNWAVNLPESCPANASVSTSIRIGLHACRAALSHGPWDTVSIPSFAAGSRTESHELESGYDWIDTAYAHFPSKVGRQGLRSRVKSSLSQLQKNDVLEGFSMLLGSEKPATVRALNFGIRSGEMTHSSYPPVDSDLNRLPVTDDHHGSVLVFEVSFSDIADGFCNVRVGVVTLTCDETPGDVAPFMSAYPSEMIAEQDICDDLREAPELLIVDATGTILSDRNVPELNREEKAGQAEGLPAPAAAYASSELRQGYRTTVLSTAQQRVKFDCSDMTRLIGIQYDGEQQVAIVSISGSIVLRLMLDVRHVLQFLSRAERAKVSITGTVAGLDLSEMDHISLPITNIAGLWSEWGALHVDSADLDTADKIRLANNETCGVCSACRAPMNSSRLEHVFEIPPLQPPVAANSASYASPDIASLFEDPPSGEPWKTDVKHVGGIIPSAPDDTPASQIACQTCTFLNVFDEEKCTVCDQRLPDEPQWTCGGCQQTLPRYTLKCTCGRSRSYAKGGSEEDHRSVCKPLYRTTVRQVECSHGRRSSVCTVCGDDGNSLGSSSSIPSLETDPESHEPPGHGILVWTPGAGQEWQCATCTFSNKWTSQKCEICETLMPKASFGLKGGRPASNKVRAGAGASPIGRSQGVRTPPSHVRSANGRHRIGEHVDAESSNSFIPHPFEDQLSTALQAALKRRAIYLTSPRVESTAYALATNLSIFAGIWATVFGVVDATPMSQKSAFKSGLAIKGRFGFSVPLTVPSGVAEAASIALPSDPSATGGLVCAPRDESPPLSERGEMQCVALHFCSTKTRAAFWVLIGTGAVHAHSFCLDSPACSEDATRVLRAVVRPQSMKGVAAILDDGGNICGGFLAGHHRASLETFAGNRVSLHELISTLKAPPIRPSTSKVVFGVAPWHDGNRASSNATGLPGLINSACGLSNACYLNSLLQALRMTDGWLNQLISAPLSQMLARRNDPYLDKLAQQYQASQLYGVHTADDITGAWAVEDEPGALLSIAIEHRSKLYRSAVLNRLQWLMGRLTLSQRPVHGVFALKRLMPSEYKTGMQQDSTEFLHFLSAEVDAGWAASSNVTEDGGSVPPFERAFEGQIATISSCLHHADDDLATTPRITIDPQQSLVLPMPSRRAGITGICAVIVPRGCLQNRGVDLPDGWELVPGPELNKGRPIAHCPAVFLAVTRERSINVFEADPMSDPDGCIAPVTDISVLVQSRLLLGPASSTMDPSKLSKDRPSINPSICNAGPVPEIKASQHPTRWYTIPCDLNCHAQSASRKGDMVYVAYQRGGHLAPITDMAVVELGGDASIEGVEGTDWVEFPSNLNESTGGATLYLRIRRDAPITNICLRMVRQYDKRQAPGIPFNDCSFVSGSNVDLQLGLSMVGFRPGIVRPTSSWCNVAVAQEKRFAYKQSEASDVGPITAIRAVPVIVQKHIALPQRTRRRWGLSTAVEPETDLPVPLELVEPLADGWKLVSFPPEAGEVEGDLEVEQTMNSSVAGNYVLVQHGNGCPIMGFDARTHARLSAPVPVGWEVLDLAPADVRGGEPGTCGRFLGLWSPEKQGCLIGQDNSLAITRQGNPREVLLMHGTLFHRGNSIRIFICAAAGRDTDIRSPESDHATFGIVGMWCKHGSSTMASLTGRLVSETGELKLTFGDVTSPKAGMVTSLLEEYRTVSTTFRVDHADDSLSTEHANKHLLWPISEIALLAGGDPIPSPFDGWSLITSFRSLPITRCSRLGANSETEVGNGPALLRYGECFDNVVDGGRLLGDPTCMYLAVRREPMALGVPYIIDISAQWLPNGMPDLDGDDQVGTWSAIRQTLSGANADLSIRCNGSSCEAGKSLYISVKREIATDNVDPNNAPILEVEVSMNGEKAKHGWEEVTAYDVANGYTASGLLNVNCAGASSTIVRLMKRRRGSSISAEFGSPLPGLFHSLGKPELFVCHLVVSSSSHRAPGSSSVHGYSPAALHPAHDFSGSKLVLSLAGSIEGVLLAGFVGSSRQRMEEIANETYAGRNSEQSRLDCDDILQLDEAGLTFPTEGGAYGFGISFNNLTRYFPDLAQSLHSGDVVAKGDNVAWYTCLAWMTSSLYGAGRSGVCEVLFEKTTHANVSSALITDKASQFVKATCIVSSENVVVRSVLYPEHIVRLMWRRDTESFLRDGHWVVRPAAASSVPDVQAMVETSVARVLKLNVACELCAMRTEQASFTTYVVSPAYLQVHLARMRFDQTTKRAVKNQLQVRFAPRLVLPGVPPGAIEHVRAAVAAKTSGAAGPANKSIQSAKAVDLGLKATAYGLYAVIVHTGDSANSGHYYTYARYAEPSWHGNGPEGSNDTVDVDAVGNAYDLSQNDCPAAPWVKFNDERLTLVKWADMIRHLSSSLTDTAYVLLYRKLRGPQSVVCAASNFTHFSVGATNEGPCGSPSDIDVVENAPTPRRPTAAWATDAFAADNARYIRAVAGPFITTTYGRLHDEARTISPGGSTPFIAGSSSVQDGRG